MRNRGLLSKTFCTLFNQLAILTYSGLGRQMGLTVKVKVKRQKLSENEKSQWIGKVDGADCESKTEKVKV